MLSTRYNPAEIENKWYEHWEKMGYFHSEPDEREPYCVLIPPPNVTGILHMGHMLNNTIQDILVRKARLDGKNACWVPGTDHASIATEAKVVRQLREKGIKKSDISREEFIKHAWDWTDKYGGIILKQLRKLGASCDWDRTVFTMDEERSEQVIKVFVDLYKKGKLYRGLRMINWDPKAKTVLSNEEVLYKEENSHLYYVRYEIVGAPADDPGVTIATTRPETILGDTAIAVHPNDERFQHLKDKKIKVPLLNREIPVVFDDYVDREFGTGALKITPAHDPNDYEIGKKHNLETIDIFNEDATLSDAAELFIGMSRFDARKAMVKQLEEEGYLLKVEPYQNKVGRSERTNSVVEPRLSLQWYVNMKELADPALKAVMDGDISFFPSNMANIYRHWLENVRDWCISRQLWWGHRIPAYYLGEELFVAETAEEALTQARKKTGNSSLQMEDLKQEEDVLDTWFSSWLWPFSVFNGLDNDNKDVAYYYPSAVLVTAWDIIFLWVARMIMAGYEWKGQLPFKHVYFTGMVRDPQGRRMSKSLGNSPDPLKLIAEYGADGVRFGMLSCSPAGNDLLFDVSLCDQGKKFCNKMWNALRLIKSWEPEDKSQSKVNKMAVTWFADLLNKRIAEQEASFAKNKLSEGLISLYSLIWTDFCSWYLELIKPSREGGIDRQTYDQTIELFSDLMIMLHPYMPFVSEELWHELAEREENNDCMVSSYPKSGDFDVSTISAFEEMKTLVSKVREVRNSKGIKRNEELELHILKGTKPEWFESDIMHCVMKAAFTGQITEIDDVPDGATGFTTGRSKWYLILNQEIDVEKELERLNAELDHNRKFVAGISKKLDNPGFVNNAPEAVVAMERKKLADGQARIENLEKSIAALQ